MSGGMAQGMIPVAPGEGKGADLGGRCWVLLIPVCWRAALFERVCLSAQTEGWRAVPEFNLTGAGLRATVKKATLKGGMEMVERVLAKKIQKKPHHTPHGLSRDTQGGAALPMVLGLACAALVLVVLWLAYTYG